MGDDPAWLISPRRFAVALCAAAALLCLTFAVIVLVLILTRPPEQGSWALLWVCSGSAAFWSLAGFWAYRQKEA